MELITLTNGIFMLATVLNAILSISKVNVYYLSITSVLLGEWAESQRVFYIQYIDGIRISVYIILSLLYALVHYEYHASGLEVLVVLEVFPLVLATFETVQELRCLNQEGFSHLYLNFGLLVYDLIKVYIMVDKKMESYSFFLLAKFAFRLLFCLFYCGYKRDMYLLKSKVALVHDPLLEANDSRSNLEQRQSPEYVVGLVSRLLFSWLKEIMEKGAKEPLEENYFYNLLDDDKTARLSEEFEICFRAEAQTIDNQDPKFSSLLLVRVLYRCGSLDRYGYLMVLMLFFDVLDFVPPQLLKLVLNFMDDPSANILYGIYLVCFMGIFSLVQTFLDTQRANENTRLYFRTKATLQTAIFKKSLRISSDIRDRVSMGKLTNLISTDAERIAMLVYKVIIAYAAIICLILVTIFLYKEIGYAAFVSEITIILTLPLTSFISRRIEKAQANLMKLRDERLKTTTQMLTSIKALKLYGWDELFSNRVEKHRLRELKMLRVCILWEVVTYFVWPFNFIFVTVATFATYTLIQGKSLDASKTFTTLSLLSILNFPLSSLPGVIMSFVEASVSLERVTSFLLLKEINALKNTEHEVNKLGKGSLKVHVKEAFWDVEGTHRALHDIKLSIQTNAFTFVTGLTGSGKSALIKLLLQELTYVNENNVVHINGTIAYSGEVPWIQNATLRENIVFDKPFEKDWYETVIFSCALTEDLRQLTHGDNTEIGERGVNLSGGQKARVALARAVYSRHEILLLENCFEAVDEHVGEHIWVHCFLGLLKGRRTVLCVTHSLKKLREDDIVLFMDNGTIISDGSLAELSVNSHPRIQSLLSLLSTSDMDRSSEMDGTLRNDTKSRLSTGDFTKKVVNDLTGEEDRYTGKVSWRVYQTYVQSAGGCETILLASIFYTCHTILWFLNTRWLAYASTHFETSFDSKVIGRGNQYVSAQDFLGVYSLIGCIQLFFLVTSTATILFGGYKASKYLHDIVLRKISRSPMSFYDTTPKGRLLNRFSKDMNVVDEVLPGNFMEFIRLFFLAAGTFFSIAAVTPYFLIVLPFTWVLYYLIQKYYISSQREIQRWTSILKSPVFSFYQETLEGSTTIRAYGRQTSFCQKNSFQIERVNRTLYLTSCLKRWLSIRIQFTGNFLRLFAGVFIVCNRDSINAGMAGLAFTFSFNIINVLNWAVRSMSSFETNLIAVERLSQYMNLESEDSEYSAIHEDVFESWPVKGVIEFRAVSARYRKGLPLVLRGLNFVIEDKERIGIVGRTGAGKSSLFLVLLRLVEPCSGKILIDGMDTKFIGLVQLRQAISVIPQDPMLFEGSVRANLDPASSFSADEILKVLKLCHMYSYLITLIRNDSVPDGAVNEMNVLNVQITDSGSNFSFGQRQLLCIGRALLKKTRILLLDEATSGIDINADRIVQDTIRKEFTDRTILTIAHRIDTIMDYNKIAVMDEGQLKELGTPKELLSNQSSLFSKLVDQST